MLVAQALCLLRILEVGEGVVAAPVAQPGLVHLPGQPFAAVEADVDAEGEPGLHAGVHEAEDRVQVVVVQVQAGPRPVAQFQAAGGAVALDAEGHTRFDRLEDADQSPGDAVALRDLPGDLLLAELAGVEVTDLATQFLGVAERGADELVGRLLAEGAEVLEGHPVGVEEVLQAQGVAELRRVPRKTSRS